MCSYDYEDEWCCNVSCMFIHSQNCSMNCCSYSWSWWQREWEKIIRIQLQLHSLIDMSQITITIWSISFHISNTIIIQLVDGKICDFHFCFCFSYSDNSIQFMETIFTCFRTMGKFSTLFINIVRTVWSITISHVCH